MVTLGCGCGGIGEAALVGGVAGAALTAILLRAYLLHAYVCTKHILCISLRWFAKDQAK